MSCEHHGIIISKAVAGEGGWQRRIAIVALRGSPAMTFRMHGDPSSAGCALDMFYELGILVGQQRIGLEKASMPL